MHVCMIEKCKISNIIGCDVSLKQLLVVNKVELLKVKCEHVTSNINGCDVSL